MLSARIVTVDYYLTTPIRGFDVTYSKFRFSTVKQVPVIRVFGITPEGKKCCIHVHGVLPYLYVPYDGGGDVDALMSRLAIDLDRGINKAFNEPYQDSAGPARPNKQYVFKVTPVSGIPFYGYHTKSHQFLKIYFYNPACIRKALALFEAGEVAGMTLQPFEGHVPYILQFFIDYNLYGMSFINLSSFVSRTVELTSSQSIAKVTYCEVEGDTVADSITNRIQAGCEPLLNPGLAGIWEDEKHRVGCAGGFDPGGVFLPPDDPPERNIIRSSSDLTFLDKLLSAINRRLEEANEGTSQPTSQIGYPQETPDVSQLQTASFLDNHNITVSHLSQTLSSSIREDPIENPCPVLDALDMSLLRAIEEVRGIRAPLENSGPDEDSILGSQPLSTEGKDDGIAEVEENFVSADDDSVLGSQLAEPEPPTDHDLDLTLPFSPPSPDDIQTASPVKLSSERVRKSPVVSSQVSQNSSRSLWEESFWSACPNLSQLESDLTGHDVSVADPERSDSEDIIYADGAFDDSDSSVAFLDGNYDSSDSDSPDKSLLPLLTTPRKRGRPSSVSSPSSRYTPLAVSVTKSPPSSSPSPRRVTRSTYRNPELLNTLKRNASLINEKIGNSPPKSDTAQSSECLSNPGGSVPNLNEKHSIKREEFGRGLKKSFVQIKREESGSSMKKSSVQINREESGSDLKKSSIQRGESGTGLKKFSVQREESESGLKKSSVQREESGSSLKKSSVQREESGSGLKKSSVQREESGSSSPESSSEPVSLWKLSSLASPNSKLKSVCLQQRILKRKSSKRRAGSLRIKVLKSSQSDSDSHDKFPETRQFEQNDEESQTKRTVLFKGNTSSDIVHFVKSNFASKGELINHSRLAPLQGILKKPESKLSDDAVVTGKRKCSLVNNRRESKDIFSDTSSDRNRSQNLEQNKLSQQSSASSPLAVSLSQHSDSGTIAGPFDISCNNNSSSSSDISDADVKRAKKVLFSWDSDNETSFSVLSTNEDATNASQVGVESFYETTMIKADGIEWIYARADPPPPISSFDSIPSDPNLFPCYKNPRDRATSKEVGFEVVKLPSVRLGLLLKRKE